VRLVHYLYACEDKWIHYARNGEEKNIGNLFVNWWD
jgi:hypothetical protein